MKGFEYIGSKSKTIKKSKIPLLIPNIDDPKGIVINISGSRSIGKTTFIYDALIPMLKSNHKSHIVTTSMTTNAGIKQLCEKYNFIIIDN